MDVLGRNRMSTIKEIDEDITPISNIGKKRDGGDAVVSGFEENTNPGSLASIFK